MESLKNTSIQPIFSRLFDAKFSSFSTERRKSVFRFTSAELLRIFLIFLLCMSSQLFSQQTLVKSFSSDATSIEISTDGLDEIKIINSESDQIEVNLFDENPHAHHILIDERASILKIGFELHFLEEDAVFRKYITKRLHRASVVIKLPKNKDLTILGKGIDVISNNYDGNISIYIDKGLVNLHQVQQNATIKLFQGNVFAWVFNSNVTIKSNKGKILVNEKLHPKEYKKEDFNFSKKFTLSTINANVSLTIK